MTTPPCELCAAVPTVAVEGWDGTWACPCGKRRGHVVCYPCIKEWCLGPTDGALVVCVDVVHLARELMGRERPQPEEFHGFPHVDCTIEDLLKTPKGQRISADLIKWRKQVGNHPGPPNPAAPVKAEFKFGANVVTGPGMDADLAKMMVQPDFEKRLMESMVEEIARDAEADMMGGEELVRAVREAEEKRKLRERLLEP